MPKVAVFTIGGTISCVYDEENGSIPTLSGEELIHEIENDLHGIKVELHDVCRVPSSQLNATVGFELNKKIEACLLKDDIDGAVVVQGTDSLDEMSYLQSILHGGDKPIIFTGAMKSHSEALRDARGNLLNAIETAAADESKGKGVLVLLNETIFSAYDVEKMNTTNVDAFSSPNGSLGVACYGEVKYYHYPIKEKTYKPKYIEENVVLLKAYTGMDDFLIRACVEHGVKGIVIEAFGAGNLSGDMLECLQSTVEKGIPIVLVSRCIGGYVVPVYNYLGGGKMLMEKIGLINGGNLSGQKARMKLSVLVSMGYDAKQIKKEFEHNH